MGHHHVSNLSTLAKKELAITRQCPLIGSQALACPLQLQPAQVPRYEPPGTRSKPEEHISQDRPEYPGEHLQTMNVGAIM